MIEDVEDDVDELPNSYFDKAAAMIFDQIDNGKNGVLPSSIYFYLIETLGEVFHSEDLAGHLRKVDPNESGSLDRFSFVRWYVEEEVSLDSAEDTERLVGWAFKVGLVDIQREIFLIIHALKRERKQERLYFKEG